MKKFSLLFLIGWLGLAGTADSIPNEITYQGTLKEKGLPANGSKNMFFRVTNEDGTQVYWSSGSRSVKVTNGLFATQLAPTGFDWESVTPYIEVSIEGQLLLPREPVASTVYATLSRSVTNGSVAWDKLSPGVQSLLVPTGSVMAFAGAGPPSDWLVCDGSAVSRTTYARLFAAIGITWGPGNGSTTFNLPDMRGRTLVGVGQGPGLSNRILAATTGEEMHVLSPAEMPSHTHGVSDPKHRHHLDVAIGGANGGGNAMLTTPGAAGAYSDFVATGISIQNSGGDAAHNTMQPSLFINYIIKT